MRRFTDDSMVPVFVINGFLEAGKTSFIIYTISSPYFHTSGTTLLIVCEEGETEYPERLLRREKVIIVSAVDQDKLTDSFLKELDTTYRPERVIVEYNGMWGDPDAMPCPENWGLYQQITVMDGSTIAMYLANMKPLMGPMLKNSELCIVNRCDGIPESSLTGYKQKLRPMLMLPGASVEMEDRDGPIALKVLDEELPYDVHADTVVIPDEDYGIFFIDARDYPERYRGKKLRFRAQVMRNRWLKPQEFVPMRLVMTCCEADMQPLGFIARFDGLSAYRDGEWVMLTADMDYVYRDEYEGEGPYLRVRELTRTGPADGPAGF